jgi:hypothetical protein
MSGTYILEHTQAFSLGGLTCPARGLRASSTARGLHISSPPSRGLLRFGLPPQWRRHSPSCARGLSPGLHSDRGWTVAPAGDEGHMNVWGSAAPDEQRLQAPRGGAWLRHWWRTRRQRQVRQSPPRLVPLQGVKVGVV